MAWLFALFSTLVVQIDYHGNRHAEKYDGDECVFPSPAAHADPFSAALRASPTALSLIARVRVLVNGWLRRAATESCRERGVPASICA